jgi:CRP-like cAMP-binding protein
MLDLNQAIVASVEPTYAEIRAIPLFSDLSEIDFEQVSKGLECIHIHRGTYLYRQGERADSTFFVQNGTLTVTSILPGGGETRLVTLGPGSVIGETSLISDGIRSASVRAETDVIGYSMERSYFQGAIALANSAAGRILGNLARILSQRICCQTRQLIDAEHRDLKSMACRNSPGFGKDIDDAAGRCSFPYREYLSRFDFFSEFQSREIDEIDCRCHSMEIPQGSLLFEKGEHPVSCYFIVRGSLELCIAGKNSQIPLAILGPGSFLGTTEIIAGGARVACGRVREDAVLLEFSAVTMHELLADQSILGSKFQHALCEHLIVDLAKINKSVARLASPH